MKGTCLHASKFQMRLEKYCTPSFRHAGKEFIGTIRIEVMLTPERKVSQCHTAAGFARNDVALTCAQIGCFQHVKSLVCAEGIHLKGVISPDTSYCVWASG